MHLTGPWIGTGLPITRPVEDLKLVVEALNGRLLFAYQPLSVSVDTYDRLVRETPKILREFVELWKSSGPNFEQMCRDWPTLRDTFHRYWKNQVQITEGRSGGANVVCLLADRYEKTAQAEALRQFTLLVLNPAWDKLGGPCARCGRYYIKKRTSQKVYCQRRCANADTATRRTRQRLDQEHKQKLFRATTAAQRWLSSHTRLDWKQFISREEPDITPKFLTRAVNKGELRAPKRGR